MKIKGTQPPGSPVWLFPPSHVGVTRSHKGLPGSDHILGGLGAGENQEVAGSSGHVTYQLLKDLLVQKRETGWMGIGVEADQPHSGTLC